MILQKNKLKQSLIHLIRSCGLNISKLSKVNYSIYKLHSIKNFKEKLEEIKRLIKKYPNDPKTHYELVRCLQDMCDPYQFEAIREYGNVKEKWLKETGFDQLDIEFVHPDLVIGAFGSYCAIENLIRANELGLRKKRKLFLLMPKNEKFRNSTLAKYFKKYINFIKGNELDHETTSLHSLLALPLGPFIPLKNEYVPGEIAANRCEQEVQKRKLNYSTFTLGEEDYEQGNKALKKFGLPNDAWYVTLHVREPGYRGETAKNSTEGSRNANPLNYIKAIKRIINSGGWVFRMGDPSMTPLPKIKGLIDYAHSPLKSELLDVFLLATSKFLVGTDSGPMRIPGFFGVPIILTNNIKHLTYYSLKQQDLFMPRLIKKISNKKNIKLEQMLSKPTSLYIYESQFKGSGLYWEENSPEDIEFSVIEMLERIDQTENKLNNYPLTKEQLEFKKIAEAKGGDYANSVEAFTPCSKHFLNNNADIF